MKKVIWIIWKMWAWKDIVWDYISEKFWINKYIISSKLKEEADKKWIEKTRINLINIWRELAMEFWDWILAQKLLEDSKWDIILAIWMRQLWQLDFFKKNTNFTLIWIESSDEIRFERIIKRRKFWDAKTLKQFKEEEKEEDGKSVQKISHCLNMADYIIENNGDLEEFFEKIDNILKDILTN